MNGFYWIYLVMMAFLLGYECIRNRENKRLLFYTASGFLILMFTLQDGSVSVDIAEYMRQWEIQLAVPMHSFGDYSAHHALLRDPVSLPYRDRIRLMTQPGMQLPF